MKRLKTIALVALALGAIVAAAAATYNAGKHSAFLEVGEFCAQGCRMWVDETGWLKAERGAQARCAPTWRF